MSSSPFTLFPSSWLSLCFQYLDLDALRSVAQVNRHWSLTQQKGEAWTTDEDDWDTSRCFRPKTYEEMRNVPNMFRKRLTNMAIDLAQMFLTEPSDEEGEEGDATGGGDDAADAVVEDAAPPLPVVIPPLFDDLFDRMPSLRSLDISDIDSLILPPDMDVLLRRSVAQLHALSFQCDSTTSLDRLLQPSSYEPCHLRRLHLMYSTIQRNAFEKVFQSLKEEIPTYVWPLQQSLTALTITLAESNTILPLTHIPLRQLDLTIDGNLAPADGDGSDSKYWRCVYLHQVDSDAPLLSVTPAPSAWCHSLRKLNLTATNIHDDVVRAISHLTQLTDLAILNTPDLSDASLRKSDRCPSLADWSDVLSPLVGPTSKLTLTPRGIYHLRHLHQLVRLELELEHQWILPLVPFMTEKAVTDDARHRLHDSTILPLAFWSSFPNLFCFRYRSHSQLDYPCISSLSELDAARLESALEYLAPSSLAASSPSTGVGGVRPQDLLLYALAACDGLRSLHIRTSQFQSESFHTFVERRVCREIRKFQSENRILPIHPHQLSNQTESSPSSTNLGASLTPLLPIFDLCFFDLPPSCSADRIALEVSSFFATLRYIHFIRCSTFTDEGLMHILNVCAYLHTLDIHGCTRLTRASLTQIGVRIPLLHSLNLSHLPNATDEVLIKILERTSDLHSLHLESTPTSSKVLVPVIIATVRLLCLNVRYNLEDWKEEDLETYKQSRPTPIQIISDYEETGEK